MAKSKKITRKQLRQPDEFVTTTGNVYQYIKAHKGAVIGAGIAFFVLVLGVSLVANWLESRQVKASYLLHQAVSVLNDPVQAPALEPESGDGHLPPQEARGYASLEEKARAALEKNDQFLASYGGSKLGPIGLLTSAGLHLDLGKADKAEELYRKYLQRVSRDKSMTFLGLQGLAVALENQGNVDEAINVLRRVSQLDSARYGAFAAYNKGRLLVGQKKLAEAKEVFKKALEDNPTSPYRGELKKSHDRLL